jgi:hypothetical protein
VRSRGDPWAPAPRCRATLPVAVGWAAAEARGHELADDLLPLLGTDGSDGWVAQGYAGGRIEADGLEWLVRQLQRWPGGDSVPQQVGLLFAVTRPNEALVTIVGGLHPDVQEVFWRRVNTIFVDPAARPLVARTLTEHRRPWGAIDLLVTMVHAVAGAVEPDADLVESALMSAATGPSDDSPRASSLAWEVGELLDYLERSGSDIEVRARLEFLYAYLLQYTRPARALNEALATAPRSSPRYCPISTSPRARTFAGAPGGQREGHGGVRGPLRVAHPSRRLSGRDRGCQRRPRLGDRGPSPARRLWPIRPGDGAIGRALAYVPPGSDGIWPAEAVRDLIRDLCSPEVDAGLHNGRLESRGMTFRSLDDGGAQERGLAAQHRGRANRVSDRWPGTGALLRRSRISSRSGRAGRTIIPSNSGTTAPEVHRRERSTWRRGAPRSL